jgi:acetoin utilization deacetylase AcuC-like enzyme
VHHGNGTEAVFEQDPSVLFISLHQWPQYPGTGPRDHAGSGAGRGATVNVPLSAHATDRGYKEAFERLVLPVATAFAPDVVLVSAGYDAHVRDPLGGMALTGAAYRFMTAALRGALPGTALVFLLEGGYDLAGVESSVTATLEGLIDVPAELEGALEPVHDRELALAVAAQRAFWPV